MFLLLTEVGLILPSTPGLRSYAAAQGMADRKHVDAAVNIEVHELWVVAAVDLGCQGLRSVCPRKTDLAKFCQKNCKINCLFYILLCREVKTLQNQETRK